MWLAPGEGIPVLKATERNGNITGVNYKIYQLPVFTGLQAENQRINAYASAIDHSVVIENPEQAKMNFRIYSVTGKLLYEGHSNDAVVTVPVNGKENIVILKVSGSFGIYARKLVL